MAKYYRAGLFYDDRSSQVAIDHDHQHDTIEECLQWGVANVANLIRLAGSERRSTQWQRIVIKAGCFDTYYGDFEGWQEQTATFEAPFYESLPHAFAVEGAPNTTCPACGHSWTR